ncbi:MAG: SOS response-associated peptidase family protein, partial [Raoultibacter sp.]
QPKESAMCGHFILVPRDILDEIIREIEIKNHVNVMPDWPARRIDAYPKSTVPLIVPDAAGRLSAQEMQWGYPVPWKAGVVFNTRAETALGDKSRMWRDSLLNRRCIVPSFGFFEPHQSEKSLSPKTGKEIKRQYRFDMPDGGLSFMAAIYEEDHFSLMTTAPNASVSPVHNRMPVVLLENELRTWLSDDFEKVFDRSALALIAQPVLEP